MNHLLYICLYLMPKEGCCCSFEKGVGHFLIVVIERESCFY
jgi:hypothetical protein